MPPAFRNNLVPTACDTPAWSAASSLAMPAAIAAQKRRCSSRPATTGRPGEINGVRPDRSERRLRLVIATPPPRCCDDHLSSANTPRSSSAAVAVTRACVPRWVRSATHTTMPCARACSPRSNANRLIAAGSRRRSRQETRCSPSSRVSTIRDAGTHRSDTSHRSTTNAGITQRPSIAAHTSLPPCSRPSRTSPSGGRRSGRP